MSEANCTAPVGDRVEVLIVCLAAVLDTLAASQSSRVRESVGGCARAGNGELEERAIARDLRC